MPLNVFAFYNGLTEQAKGYPYLKRYGNIIKELALFEVAIENDGTLRGRPSRRLINEAHAMGIRVSLVVSNLTKQGQFSTTLMSRLVRDQEFATLVWRNIRDVLVDYQLDGVNLDLEKTAPADRRLFSQLIQTWSRLFQRANFIVSIDVPAKTESDPLNVWRGSFEYKSIGQSFDEVILMTYEEHWGGSPPGSVASLSWVTQVLNYAIANIARDKIFMGIPLYGYDWPEGGTGKAISYQRAIELAQRQGAPLQWDATQHSTFFRYETGGVRHTVYFEDPRSLREKLELAEQKGIRGVALWEMNLSYPRFWEVLQMYVKR
ncbi:glycosyl hydrolase family 18 protein [Desulfosporosinus sp. BICA1-9]|uniref:glycosyl hydrolase family 18 protein n=1 Tax=Desulfosporosinus sp. BICA1-9 TaxID=1531958 RepID=UPI00054B01FB|nr:glycosyl hydrolase family 18 protein [Desulfosporosinus sp. BICA1-9]KJS50927.1 MAG: glycosyl hydrolase family 18 [Peptococcaceae bacterium BRH_c23]KJS79490.1 MAG: glycosyl hydrolase family 18 [Desulfosporosinus sp. BICA1-9]